MSTATILKEEKKDEVAYSDLHWCDTCKILQDTSVSGEVARGGITHGEITCNACGTILIEF